MARFVSCGTDKADARDTLCPVNPLCCAGMISLIGRPGFLARCKPTCNGQIIATLFPRAMFIDAEFFPAGEQNHSSE